MQLLIEREIINLNSYLLSVNGQIKNAIYTFYKDKVSPTGEILKARIFLNELDGLFIDGYKIENGRFTKKIIVKRKTNVQKAGFFLFFLQADEEETEDDCWNVENLPGEGNEYTFDVVDLGTVQSGGSSSTSSNSNYSIITHWNFINQNGDGGPTNSPGGYSSVAGSIYANNNSTDDESEEGECPDGYVKNLTTGDCNPICSGGKIYNTTTKKCECPEGKVEDSNGNCVDDCDTSKEDLKKVFPSASDSKLKEIADAINTYGKDFGIDNKDKLRHFLSQAGHESTKMTAFEENLNYRWKKLGETNYWKKYFNLHTDGDKDSTKANPNDFKRSATSVYVNKEKFANHVYDDANREEGYKLGNTSEGDGYKYRGRGIIQLTGKSNYEKFNTFYQDKYDKNKNLVSNPDLVKTDMKIAIISALWFFNKEVIDKTIVNDKTTVKSVTLKVNGGTNGLPDRKKLYKKAKDNIDCK